MGVQRYYEKLVKRWGREIANEIFSKRSSTEPLQFSKKQSGAKKAKKVRIDALDAHWARAAGSFENGRKR